MAGRAISSACKRASKRQVQSQGVPLRRKLDAHRRYQCRRCPETASGGTRRHWSPISCRLKQSGNTTGRTAAIRPAKPDDPGVAVYFQIGGEPHCLPCDTYLLVEHNIAAIAAHIEATRAIERHGVASVREMFSGFAALPAPQKWFEILGVSAGSNADVIRAAYRALAAKRHPDRPGGSHDAMSELNKARDDGMRAIGAHS